MSVYQVDTDGGSYEVTTDDKSVEPDMSMARLAQNTGENGKSVASSALNAAKPVMDPLGVGESIFKGSTQPMIDRVTGETAREGLKSAIGIPGSLVNEGKRIGAGELLTGHPIEAAKKFGRAAYDQPVTTALDVATLFGLGKNSTPEAPIEPPVMEPPVMPEPVSAPVSPTAPPRLNLPPEAAEAMKPSPVAPPKPSPSFGEKLTNAASNIPSSISDPAKEVKDYVSRGYEGFAKKPGAISNVADYVQEKSQMMSAKQMGITPLQARQLGHEAVRAIGQYGLDNEIVSGTTGLRGMRAKNTSLMNEAGNTLKQVRQAADKTGQIYKPGELLQAVKSKLDQKYLRGVTEESPSARGVYGSESGPYQKALQELEDFDHTHTGAAHIATELNKFANKANKLNQPHGAYTDVANEISHINNQRINKLVPDKAPAYDQALREYGVNKKISAALDRKEAGEVKREGPGSLTSNFYQKALDEAGYKIGAKVANKVSGSILKNPAIAKSLPSLFKEFINQVEEEGHDMTGMSEGGVVTPQIREFVGKR